MSSKVESVPACKDCLKNSKDLDKNDFPDRVGVLTDANFSSKCSNNHLETKALSTKQNLSWVRVAVDLPLSLERIVLNEFENCGIHPLG